MTGTTESLLAGPRGRRLCWSLAVPGSAGIPAWAWNATEAPSEATVGAACRELERLDSHGLAADPDRIVVALVEAVNSAWYWQTPDEVDLLLERPEIQDALAPLARAVEQSPTGSWWRLRMDPEHQSYVQWLDQYPTGPPALQGAHQRLARWTAETMAAGAQRCAEQALRGPGPGPWESVPGPSTLLITTGPGPGLEALGLVAVEDGSDPDAARTWPLAPSHQARILEITASTDWVRLVETYPLEITCSTREDWPQIPGRWLIPDWAAVAGDYDGAHLSVHAYLTTAGRALPAGGGHTVLAGWDPDATCWLDDVLTHTGHPTDWTRAPDNVLPWHHTTPEPHPRVSPSPP